MLEILGHVVRSVWRPIISFQVFQQAQENGVNSHQVDTEEGIGNKVASKYNENNWSPSVM